jgi:signal peptidase II
MIPIIIAAILFLDQLAKFVIVRNLSLNQSIPVIPGIFHLTLVHNKGAAFGLLKGQLSLFIFTSVLAVFLIVFTLKDNKQARSNRAALALILAGALGNLVDRLFYGHVIDFLDFRVWPVFNVADSAITVGAILLGWFILKNPKQNAS